LVFLTWEYGVLFEMNCCILHLVIDGFALRTSSDPNPPSASRIYIVYKQPLPIWVGAFCFLAAAQPIRQ
jgi:hypothetical protein